MPEDQLCAALADDAYGADVKFGIYSGVDSFGTSTGGAFEFIVLESAEP